MGRIKTRKIKSITTDLLEQHPDQLTADFAQNKQKVKELTGVESKKLRNVIAGYATRLLKERQ